MTKKLSLRDLKLKNLKVLMRVDFNVPLDEELFITDDTRIRASLASIHYILEQGASLILMSHLGRPKGKVKTELSLKPCAKRLSELLGKKVVMAPDSIGDTTSKLANNLEPGQVMLLENLRFHSSEEDPDQNPEFAQKLAKLAEVYVNDAFGTAHRKHSSNVTITQYFPNASVCGFLMEKELKFLGSALLNPKHPFYALIGGAKISSKIGVIHSLLQKVDGLVIIGAMAFTFLKAQGIEIGKSLVEDDFIETARSIIHTCQQTGTRLILPTDLVIAEEITESAVTSIIDTALGIPKNSFGLDIGPKSIDSCKKLLHDANTILWNGPAGVFECPPFAKGTFAIAKLLANSSAISIVGGGDSIAALNQSGLSDQITHISTGGGATLEYIEYGTLPAIESLSNTNQ